MWGHLRLVEGVLVPFGPADFGAGVVPFGVVVFEGSPAGAVGFGLVVDEGGGFVVLDAGGAVAEGDDEGGVVGDFVAGGVRFVVFLDGPFDGASFFSCWHPAPAMASETTKMAG